MKGGYRLYYSNGYEMRSDVSHYTISVLSYQLNIDRAERQCS